MRKNIFFIFAIVILLGTSLYYWHVSRAAVYRLTLIQERLESRRGYKEENSNPPIKDPAGEPEYKAKTAFVVDDWGYNLKNLRAALNVGAPITFSVLPNLPYSAEIAETANAKGFTVILHLPLESHEGLNFEKGTITTNMADEEIVSALEKAISGVPGIKGVSNHMGSKATESERVMSVILSRLKEKGLFFLDSLVTSASVCAKVARETGIRFARRSVFLDNRADIEYIKNQIRELARQALATGSAVGIGHDKFLTIKAIKEMIPELEKMRIKIVPVSELAG